MIKMRIDKAQTVLIMIYYLNLTIQATKIIDTIQIPSSV